jgi:hypothetical protein
MPERKNTMRLPRIACELTPQGVAAARAEGKKGTIGTIQSCALGAGVLTPTLTAQNVQDAKALSDAIGQAVTAVGESESLAAAP